MSKMWVLNREAFQSNGNCALANITGYKLNRYEQYEHVGVSLYSGVQSEQVWGSGAWKARAWGEGTSGSRGGPRGPGPPDPRF